MLAETAELVQQARSSEIFQSAQIYLPYCLWGAVTSSKAVSSQRPQPVKRTALFEMHKSNPQAMQNVSHCLSVVVNQ